MPSDDPDFREPRGRIGKLGAGLIGIFAVVAGVMFYGQYIVSGYYNIVGQIESHTNPTVQNPSPNAGTLGKQQPDAGPNPPAQNPSESANPPSKQQQEADNSASGT